MVPFWLNFGVSFRNQHNQYIDWGFTEHLISHGVSIDSTDNEESEEGDDVNSQQLTNMEVDNSPDMSPPDLSEEIPPGPNTQPSLQQDASPSWFMEYFGWLNSTIEWLEQRQLEHHQQQMEYHESESESELAYLSFHIGPESSQSPSPSNQPPSSPHFPSFWWYPKGREVVFCLVEVSIKSLH